MPCTLCKVEEVLIFNCVLVFHAFCRNATTAIKINHMTLPRINLLHINFTPFLFTRCSEVSSIPQGLWANRNWIKANNVPETQDSNLLKSKAFWKCLPGEKSLFLANSWPIVKILPEDSGVPRSWVDPIRNSSRYDSKPSGALNPTGTVTNLIPL